MPPAVRIGDLHVCPLSDGPKPHLGGPVLPAGAPTVLIAGMPAARLGDLATCAGPPDAIVKGSGTVLIGGLPAARVGDVTAHGGSLTVGCPNVLIGEGAAAGAANGALVPPDVRAAGLGDLVVGEGTHFVEIELVDEDGIPIPREAYRLQFPDGRVIEGHLDDEGRARIEGLEQGGACELSLPRLDGECWDLG